MSRPIPERFHAEQREVEQDIREAFRGVSRRGGTSWSESVAVDRYGSDLEREQARANDTESCWEELVDAPSWNHERGLGGFNFLDSVGFRYYIAPALIRCVREGGGEFTSYALTVDCGFKQRLVSLINPRQAAAVARAIRLLVELHEAAGDSVYGEPWVRAYRLHWHALDGC